MQKFLTETEQWLDRLYVAAEGASLRREDRRKAVETAAMLVEIERAAARLSGRKGLLLLDAAAGKSYVGLLAAKLILAPRGDASSVVTLERDPRRVEASRRAAERLEAGLPVACLRAEGGDPSAWPAEPDIVTALHACGDAADEILDRAVACRARVLLLAPCCTGRAVRACALAERRAAALDIPRHAPVRRRFIQALVDAERTWRLEAAGYETEVVEFVPPTVTPHNLLWRARRVGEPRRTASARAAWERLSAVG